MNDATEHDAVAPTIPQAVIAPERRLSWLWLVPIAALIAAGWLGYRAWTGRGITVTVALEEGHGLAPGDEVRYRGTVVGEVGRVELTEDAGGIVVVCTLQPPAASLARAGARFWVVRPKLGVTGVEGLDTIVGPRYLAILPGDGPVRRRFVGLEEPPVIPSPQPDDLQVVVEAPRRNGLRVGAPVLYRQVLVGTILSVGLSGDATAVNARLLIRKAYRPLIRPETRFWSAGGLTADVSFRGFTVDVESVATLLEGGVALATPETDSPPVRSGHRFELVDKPETDWLAWSPRIAIGSDLLPAGAPMPTPLHATLAWQKGRWIKSTETRQGWVLPTSDGLLGPADLLDSKASGEGNPVELEVAGRLVSLDAGPKWSANGLALIDVDVDGRTWPSLLQRTADQPEDCLAVADAGGDPMPLSAGRLHGDDGHWTIDSAVSLDVTWHGAAVLSRADGKLLGMILIDDAQQRVALLPGNP